MNLLKAHLPRVVLDGVDTLHLAAKAPIRADVEMRLVASKAAAVHAAKRQGPAPLLDLGGMSFKVSPHGSRTGIYLLLNDNMAVSVYPGPPRNLPTLFVELRALFLWQVGAERAHRAACVVAGDICDPLPGLTEEGLLRPPEIQFGVSRIDLTIDFQGWAPPPDPDAYTCRATRIDPHYVRRRFTGLSFGKSALMARLYDKTEEIATSNKTWFHALWSMSPAFASHERVWRLEFQLRRGALRSIRFKGTDRRLRTLQDVVEYIVPLSRYLCSQWLSIRGQRTNSNRQVLTAEWSALRDSAFSGGALDGCQDNLYRIARELTRERCTGQLAGHVRRHLALTSIEEGRPVELEEFWKNLLQVVLRYGDRRGRPLEAMAAKLATAITKNENAALSHAAQTVGGIPLAPGENPSGGFDAQGS